MVILWGGLALVIVLVIAAVVIGRETHRLAGEPPRPVFDLDEAVDWVATHLPNEVTAELSHDDVRQILRWNLEFFRSKGVTRNGKSPDEPATDIVVAGGETVDHVLHRAAEIGVEYTALQVHAVLDAQMAYLQAIGALGPAKPDDAPPA
jgi:hypothetical protein